jgi:hypothetical protein
MTASSTHHSPNLKVLLYPTGATAQQASPLLRWREGMLREASETQSPRGKSAEPGRVKRTSRPPIEPGRQDKGGLARI